LKASSAVLPEKFGGEIEAAVLRFCNAQVPISLNGIFVEEKYKRKRGGAKIEKKTTK